MTDTKQTTQDPFEMFRRLWAPLGLPVPGMAMPTLDPAEVEKRIADLKSVETWLGMNINMVRMAIQGLEVQKLALNALQTNAGAAGDAVKAFADFSRNAASGVASAAPRVPAADAAADPAANPAVNPAVNPAGNPAVNPMANPMLWPWAMMQGVAGPAAAVAKAPGPKKDGKNRKEGK